MPTEPAQSQTVGRLTITDPGGFFVRISIASRPATALAIAAVLFFLSLATLVGILTEVAILIGRLNPAPLIHALVLATTLALAWTCHALMPAISLGLPHLLTSDGWVVIGRERPAAPLHFELFAAEIGDLRVRRALARHELVAVDHCGAKRRVIMSGTLPEVDAAHAALRASLGLPDDPFALALYGRLLDPASTPAGWRATPTTDGVYVARRPPLSRLLILLLIAASGFILANPALNNPAAHPRIGLALVSIATLALAIRVIWRRVVKPITGYRLRGQDFHAPPPHPLAATYLPTDEIREFAANGPRVDVIDPDALPRTIGTFASDATAAWFAQVLDAALRSSRRPARAVRPREALPVNEARAKTIPAPRWTPAVSPILHSHATSRTISEKWGIRYARLTRAWRALYAADRRWFRRVIEGPPFHTRPRQPPRRQFRP